MTPSPADAARPSSLTAVPTSPRWSRTERRAHVAWAVASSVAVLLVLMVTNVWPSVGWPLLVASASAYLLDPLVTRMSRSGLSRTAAAVLLYGVLLSVAGLALVLGGQALRVGGRQFGLPRCLVDVRMQD